jgi:hypothetical protein
LTLTLSAGDATGPSIFTPTVDLPAGAYSWTVQARDAAGNTSPAVSPAASFVIGRIKPQILNSPNSLPLYFIFSLNLCSFEPLC